MGDWKQPEGLYARRLSFNPREVAFAGRWAIENRPMSPSGSIVEILMGDKYEEFDEVKIATFAQWLGTNVGFAFVRGALEAAGYEVKEVQRG